MRLDRFLRRELGFSGGEARGLVAGGGVLVNGETAGPGSFQVGKFDRVECVGEVLQDRRRRVVMLNKPAGVVCATRDESHPTVLDLVGNDPELHIAGRLDRFTTGLVLLTNDSGFSEGLTRPEMKVGKRYLVGVDGEVTDEVLAGLGVPMWFGKEGVWTESAVVVKLGFGRVRITIFEGKHHQLKRMFARFGLRVTSLHREAIGEFELGDLGVGEWGEVALE